MPAKTLRLIGLGLNVVGVALIFMFAYPHRTHDGRPSSSGSRASRSCWCSADSLCSSRQPFMKVRSREQGCAAWSGKCSAKASTRRIRRREMLRLLKAAACRSLARRSRSRAEAEFAPVTRD